MKEEPLHEVPNSIWLRLGLEPSLNDVEDSNDNDKDNQNEDSSQIKDKEKDSENRNELPWGQNPLLLLEEPTGSFLNKFGAVLSSQQRQPNVMWKTDSNPSSDEEDDHDEENDAQDEAADPVSSLLRMCVPPSKSIKKHKHLKKILCFPSLPSFPSTTSKGVFASKIHQRQAFVSIVKKLEHENKTATDALLQKDQQKDQQKDHQETQKAQSKDEQAYSKLSCNTSKAMHNDIRGNDQELLDDDTTETTPVPDDVSKTETSISSSPSIKVNRRSVIFPQSSQQETSPIHSTGLQDQDSRKKDLEQVLRAIKIDTTLEKASHPQSIPAGSQTSFSMRRTIFPRLRQGSQRLNQHQPKPDDGATENKALFWKTEKEDEEAQPVNHTRSLSPQPSLTAAYAARTMAHFHPPQGLMAQIDCSSLLIPKLSKNDPEILPLLIQLHQEDDPSLHHFHQLLAPKECLSLLDHNHTEEETHACLTQLLKEETESKSIPDTESDIPTQPQESNNEETSEHLQQSRELQLTSHPPQNTINSEEVVPQKNDQDLQMFDQSHTMLDHLEGYCQHNRVPRLAWTTLVALVVALGYFCLEQSAHEVAIHAVTQLRPGTGLWLCPSRWNACQFLWQCNQTHLYHQPSCRRCARVGWIPRSGSFSLWGLGEENCGRRRQQDHTKC